jgi:hypothetical protein
MNFNLVGLNLMLCVLSIVAISTSINLSDITVATKVQLRNTHVDLQRMQQSISILENAEYQELIVELDSGLNELKISIAEFISDRDVQSEASGINYQLDIRESKILPQSLYPIHILRLDLKFRTDNSNSLTGFLQEIKRVVNPWPTEVRACEIHRLVISRLLVNCKIDIHFWSLYD